MGTMASQITSLTIVYSTVCSGAEQRKHQSSASLAFVRGIHRGPVNSTQKWPVMRKIFHLMTSSWQYMCLCHEDIMSYFVADVLTTHTDGQSKVVHINTYNYGKYGNRIMDTYARRIMDTSAQYVFNENIQTISIRIRYFNDIMNSWHGYSSALLNPCTGKSLFNCFTDGFLAQRIKERTALMASC